MVVVVDFVVFIVVGFVVAVVVGFIVAVVGFVVVVVVGFVVVVVGFVVLDVVVVGVSFPQSSTHCWILSLKQLFVSFEQEAQDTYTFFPSLSFLQVK